MTYRRHAGYQPLLHQLTARSAQEFAGAAGRVPVGLAEELQRLVGELKLV